MATTTAITHIISAIITTAEITNTITQLSQYRSLMILFGIQLKKIFFNIFHFINALYVII